MELTFKQIGTVGIFNFSGELISEHEDNLKLALMRAIHSIDRAVLNFKRVTLIDLKCLQLIKQAYFTSIRLQNPFIMTNMPQNYMNFVSSTFQEDTVRSFTDEYEHTDTDKKTVYN